MAVTATLRIRLKLMKAVACLEGKTAGLLASALLNITVTGL